MRAFAGPACVLLSALSSLEGQQAAAQPLHPPTISKGLHAPIAGLPNIWVAHNCLRHKAAACLLPQIQMTLGTGLGRISESFQELPLAGASAGDGHIELSAGRPGQAHSLLVRGDGPAWSTPGGDSWFVEFWLKPADWNGLSAEAVELCRWIIGDEAWVLQKPENHAELWLTREGIPVFTYPIYDWHEQEWMGRDERVRWHHILLSGGNGNLRLYVDGFPATAPTGSPHPEGLLHSMALAGGPGTQFSELLVASPHVTADQVRPRYRSLYRGVPLLRPQTITVPWLTEPPEAGAPDEAYPGMAAFGPFNTLAGGAHGPLDGSGVRGYIGYDDENLYLSLVTPYEGTLNTRAWGVRNRPLWGEESFEIYLVESHGERSDYIMLVGNPHGDVADMRERDLNWNGNWQWQAEIGEHMWRAGAIIPFTGIGMPTPGVSAVWGMNLFNNRAGIAWSPARAFHDTEAFGILRFDQHAPVLRPGGIQVDDGQIQIPLTALGRGHDRVLLLGAEVYADGDLLPTRHAEKSFALASGQSLSVALDVAIPELSEGILSVYVKDGDDLMYANTVRFPASLPEPRTGESQSTGEPEQAGDGWSASELGDALLGMHEWMSGGAGSATDVMRPWTAVEVEGDTIHCWGRSYIYDRSLFPVSILSQGEELLAGTPYLRMLTADGAFDISAADVVTRRIDDLAAYVESRTEAGGYRISTQADYAFDGMAKINLRIAAAPDAGRIESLALVIPLEHAKSELFHYLRSNSGGPPGTDAGAVTDGGFDLDQFRELIWTGDTRVGLAWFAEGMRNWRLRDENNIQVLARNDSADARLIVTFINTPTLLDSDWEITFAIQATPTVERPVAFRSRSDRSAVNWQWRYWGDGDFYPFVTDAEPARQQIERARQRGQEIMPTSSLSNYGLYRFYESAFGPVDHPGLMHREVVLWEPLWRQTHLPVTGHLEFNRVHTAPDDGRGPRQHPRGSVNLCPNSPHLDHYLWKLRDTVERTGLGAINLLQSSFNCSNVLHGCGYTNYKGEWVSSMPIFAMREMAQRMKRIFYDAHGQSQIRWHAGNRIPVPILAYVDTYMDGENYTQGALKVYEFYSDILSPERMRAQHTGIQFGFAPDFLPKMENQYAPSPASVSDMLGLLFVHDINTFSASTAHNAYSRYLQDRRLGADPDDKRTAYYWEDHGLVEIADPALPYILHYGPGNALLIVYNPGHEAVDASLWLDAAGIFDSGGGLTIKDMVNGQQFIGTEGRFTVPLKAKSLRMFLLSNS